MTCTLKYVRNPIDSADLPRVPRVRVVGTSSSAGIKAGVGASNPVSGSHFPLPETKPEFGIGIGIRI